MSEIETIREKLRKIAALAERGVGGERDNAKRLLDSLLRKNGLTLADIYPKADVMMYDFVCRNKKERCLLTQCVAKVLSTNTVRYYKGRNSRRIGVKCSRIDHIEIAHMYEHFRRLFRQEEERLLEAFIHRHELFGPSDGSSKAEPLTQDEYVALIALASGMRKSNYVSTRRTLSAG